ncbi:MAG: hypothetical protein HYV28_08110 [Ignavibacteriales bacterium]|nr:hypothetical protein [Ignavibacteriales bacterium]
MNSIFLSGSSLLLLISLAVQLLSVAVIWLIKNERKAFLAANTVLLGGMITGLASALLTALYPAPSGNIILYEWLRLDPLGLYFLSIIQLVAIPTIIYNYSYLRHHIDKKKSVKSFVTFFTTLLVSTQLLVTANHAIFFLVCWEIMSMAAYLGMIFEKEKKEVQQGSFYYVTVAHALIFILYIFFFILHEQTGSWLFSSYHLPFATETMGPVLFILALIAFGIKAGFMPFHFWLPRAHPIAPTPLSAFLSGVILKTGIYGLFRTFQFLCPVPEWCGWVVLAVSLFSAIFGVWYALAQHDIKRLLAYHSVENIGIIGIGIGLGFIGSANNLPVIMYIGFGGALLHTLNHAIFKTLLFIGSGIVYQNLGTRNIELMGGIVHRSRYLAIAFLIGSVAISGVPPLNGFISEFIIFTGFFATANELKNFYPIVMLMLVVGLAFVGGLAAACFTKVNAVMFLGSPRREIQKFNTNVFDYISLGILALLCIVIGFYPAPFVGMVNSVIGSSLVNGTASAILVDMNWMYISAIFTTIALAVFALYVLKIRHEKKYGKRVSDAWGCGYEHITPRMQYTASSFADELNTIPQSVLVYHKKVTVSDTAYPVESKFESHSDDFVDTKVLLPLFGLLKWLIAKFEFLGQTDIRYSVAFILITIIVYSLIAFLWV